MFIYKEKENRNDSHFLIFMLRAVSKRDSLLCSSTQAFFSYAIDYTGPHGLIFILPRGGIGGAHGEIRISHVTHT